MSARRGRSSWPLVVAARRGRSPWPLAGADRRREYDRLVVTAMTSPSTLAPDLASLRPVWQRTAPEFVPSS
jgi:hypothetical protein